MIVFTLHRYIFGELVRVFFLSTLSLTLILSLGWMLSPIQEYGIGPKQVGDLMGYLVPITLTFVLPISAMFAVSMVYGRLAGDNELDACRAGGISITTVVYPGLCLAIIVAITTLVLSFHIVPAFVHRAERIVKANAKQIFFRNIQRKGFYSLPDSPYKIRADYAAPDKDMLMGVTIIQVDDYEVNRLITAESAKVIIEPKKDLNKVRVFAQETFQIDSNGNQVYSKKLPVSGEFEALLGDKIKFQKIEDMKRIKADMLEFKPVRDRAYAAGAQLIAELIAERMNGMFEENSEKYYEFAGSERIVQIRAENCNPAPGRRINLTGSVKAVEINAAIGEVICVYESESGYIKLNDDNINSLVTIVMEQAHWQRKDGIQSVVPVQQRAFQGFTLPEQITRAVNRGNLLSVLRDLSSVLEGEPGEELLRLRNETLRKIRNTENEIVSETHSRLVFGIGCIPLIFMAITLGIRLKDCHPLTAFGVSSVPAAVLLVMIMSGINIVVMTESAVPKVYGITLMWASLAVLSITVLLFYRKITRT